jgi:hypothetical protein
MINDIKSPFPDAPWSVQVLPLISLRFIQTHGRWADGARCEHDSSGNPVVTLDLRDGHRQPKRGKAVARFAGPNEMSWAARGETPIGWHLEEFTDTAEALRRCVAVPKSGRNDFSADWLRKAGTPVPTPLLRELVKIGCLSAEPNGVTRRGRLWYTVKRDTLPEGL